MNTKMNTQKSRAFVNNNSELSENQVLKTIPLMTASRKIKYIGFNLAKDVQDFYKENFSSLKKEFEEDIRKWKDCIYS